MTCALQGSGPEPSSSASPARPRRQRAVRHQRPTVAQPPELSRASPSSAPTLLSTRRRPNKRVWSLCPELQHVHQSIVQLYNAMADAGVLHKTRQKACATMLVTLDDRSLLGTPNVIDCIHTLFNSLNYRCCPPKSFSSSWSGDILCCESLNEVIAVVGHLTNGVVDANFNKIAGKPRGQWTEDVQASLQAARSTPSPLGPGPPGRQNGLF